MLTPRERLKVAVLQHCAEHGLTPEQTEACIKTATVRLKQANPGLGGALWGLLGGAGNMLKDIGSRAVGGAVDNLVIPGAKTMGALTLAAPLAGGAAIGHLMGRAGGVTDEDIYEERQRELIDAYHNAAQQVEANRRRAQYAAAPVSGGRQLL